ncbi:MAG: hypothetical protein ACKO1J_01395 [Tagaea sp.]
MAGAISPAGSERMAEYRRAMDVLGEVERDLRAEHKARLAELAKPARKEPVDDFSAGAPMLVATRRDRNGREFYEYRLEDPKTKRTLAVMLVPKDGGEGQVTIVSDGKDVATFTVHFREEERDKVPWDLVADVLSELTGGGSAKAPQLRPGP